MRRAARTAPTAPLDAPVRLVVEGRPMTKKNSGRVVFAGGDRENGRAFLLPSAQAKSWERTAVVQLRAQWRGRAPIAAPVTVRALVYRKRAVGDLINYLQAVADALQSAGVLADDRWIVSWDGSRPLKDADRPRVELEIAPVGA